MCSLPFMPSVQAFQDKCNNRAQVKWRARLADLAGAIHCDLLSLLLMWAGTGAPTKH